MTLCNILIHFYLQKKKKITFLFFLVVQNIQIHYNPVPKTYKKRKKITFMQHLQTAARKTLQPPDTKQPKWLRHPGRGDGLISKRRLVCAIFPFISNFFFYFELFNEHLRGKKIYLHVTVSERKSRKLY